MAANLPDVRILVVGSPGAGKSTLTRDLAARTQLPVRHLDDEYWGPGWTRSDPEEWARRQAELTSGERWIIDGNYLPTLHLRVGRATLVVLVDAAVPVCLVRVLSRAVRTWRGEHDSLPSRVRAEALRGRPVRATQDLRPLLRLAWRFRRQDWWQVVEMAGSAPAAELVIAVAPSRWRTRVAAVRRRLARRGIRAVVVPLPEVGAMIGGVMQPGTR